MFSGLKQEILKVHLSWKLESLQRAFSLERNTKISSGSNRFCYENDTVNAFLHRCQNPFWDPWPLSPCGPDDFIHFLMPWS